MASMILSGMREMREDMRRERGGGDEKKEELANYNSILEYKGTMSNEVKEFIERLRIGEELIEYRTYGYEGDDVLSLTDRQKATNLIIYEYLSIISRNNKIKILNSEEACILTHRHIEKPIIFCEVNLMAVITNDHWIMIKIDAGNMTVTAYDYKGYIGKHDEILEIVRENLQVREKNGSIQQMWEKRTKYQFQESFEGFLCGTSICYQAEMIMRGMIIESRTMQDLLAYRKHMITTMYNKYMDVKEKNRREEYMRVQIHEQCESIHTLRSQIKSGEAKIKRIIKSINLNKKN